MPQPMFRGELSFLSNFHECKITDKQGRVWPSSEHAYQAMKFPDLATQEKVRAYPLKGLKRFCKTLPGYRTDWDKVKLHFMDRIVRAKFDQNQDLMEKLKATGDLALWETNWWHDNYWGSCFCPRCACKGENQLGMLLMRIRQEQFDKQKLECQTFHDTMQTGTECPNCSYRKEN